VEALESRLNDCLEDNKTLRTLNSQLNFPQSKLILLSTEQTIETQ